jgi:dTDP-4-dehydrorhamnose reductase
MQGKNAAILILGGSGQVGTALRGQAWPDGVRAATDRSGRIRPPAPIILRMQFANAGRTTWYDLAAAIMSGARRRGAAAVPVEAVPTTAYRTAAPRPQNSELCTHDITRVFAVEPRPWRIVLEEILDALLASTQ